MWRIDWEVGRGGQRLEHRRPVKRNVDPDGERADEDLNQGPDRVELRRDWTGFSRYSLKLTQPTEFADKDKGACQELLELALNLRVIIKLSGLRFSWIFEVR